MACKVDLGSIREGIIHNIQKRLKDNISFSTISEINKDFKEEVVKLPEVGEGLARLYRAEVKNFTPLANDNWIKIGQDKSGHSEAKGRWFGANLEEIQFYVDDMDKGTSIIKYVDVPSEDLDKYSVKNATEKIGNVNKSIKSFSRNAEREWFLPKDLANDKKELVPIIEPSEELVNKYYEANKPEEDYAEAASSVIDKVSKGFELLPFKQGFSNSFTSKTGKKGQALVTAINTWIKKNGWEGDVKARLERTYGVVQLIPLNSYAKSQGGQDLSIRDKFFKDSDSTNASIVLQNIANSNHPLSPIAKRLLNYSHIINSPISIIPEDGITINNSGDDNFKAAAAHRADHSIEIAEFANFKGAGSENTLLHEIIHSYTVGLINDVPGHPLVKELDRVLEYLQANKNSIGDQYGLKNTKELVAEFFTNTRFISDLQNLPSQNKFSSYKNLWEEVLDYILSLFKLSRRDKSLYAELFPFMTNLVEEGANYEDQVNRYLQEEIDYDEFNQQQDEIYSTYPETIDYSQASDIDRLVDVSEEINDKYPEVFSQVATDFNNPNSLKVEPFSKKALPEEFSRRTIDGNLHSNEVADITNEILFKKLSRVFPKMVIREVSEQDLNQEEHLVPISDINSFVKGNTIYLVKGKFNTDSKIEELLHPFVMALYQKNKGLFDTIYEQEKRNYANIENYYSKFNPEDAKIEVVTQALKDSVKQTKLEDKTYLQKFLDFLKRVFSSLFPGQSNNISPNSSIGDISNLLLNSGYKFSTYLSNKPYYSASENLQKQLNDFNAIKNFAKNNGINKVGSDEGYIDKNGNKVLRVTEEIDEKGSKMHKNPFTSEQEAFYTAGKNIGISAHAIYDDVLSRYIDRETGLRRADKDVSPSKNLNGLSLGMYNRLEKAMLERLNTYPTGTRFLWEVVGFNPAYKKVGLAGTQDFIAILPNGQKHLLDWKFIVSSESENIPRWKRDNYEFQLQNYVEMLKLATGADDREFERVRIIPHIVSLNKDLSLKGITTPSLDLDKDVEKNRRLLPYVSSAEYLEDTEIKFFLEKISKIPELLAKQEQVLTGSGRVDKDVDDLIQNAINDFMLLGNLRPLYQIHTKLADDIATLIDAIKTATQADTIDPLNSSEINKKLDVVFEFTQAANDFLKAATYVYGRNLEKDINPGDKEGRFKDNIRELSQRMKNLSEDYHNLQRSIIDKYSRYEGITDILKEEKKVSGMGRNFTFLSAPETRSAAFFASLMARVWPKLERIVNDGYIKITNLTHNVIKEQNKKGKSSKDVINLLTDVDEKGNFNGKLRTKFTPEFNKDKQEAFATKDIEKVKEFYSKWYDLKAYKDWYDSYITEKYTDIEAQQISDNEKTRAKKNLKYYYDIETSIQAFDKVFDSKYLVQNQDFKDKYYTDFYKEIEKPNNLAIKEFYDHIISINHKAAENGFLDWNRIYTFIPNIEKGFIERGSDNFNPKKAWKTFKDKFQVVPDSGLYGNVDPITMQLDKSVFVPFVYDRFKGDYSSKSKDIFRSFALFNEELEKALAMKNLSPVADSLLRMEQMKKVIPISSTGDKLWKKGQKGVDSTPIEDDANAKYLQMFVDWNIYGRKIQESIDKRITMADGTTYSLAKFLEGGMSWMYMNAFALNFFTPARAYVSAKASTFFLKGKDFNSKSLLGFDSFINGLQLNSNKKMTAIVGYFLPLINNQFMKKADDLSINSLTSWATPDNLMYFFEKGDRMSQLETTYALLKNSVIVDGKLQNANRYINNLPEYKDIYNLNKQDMKKAEKEISRRVEELLSSSGVLTLATINQNGELEIPGLADKDEAVTYFTNLVQSYTQKTTGQTLRWDAIGYKTSLLGRIAGQYRSWIPRTVAARLGKTKFNTQTKDYQWGRWLDFTDATMRTFNDSWHKTASTVLGFRNKESLIDYAKKQYIQVRSRVQKDGRQFTKEFISEKDYVEQYLDNVNNTVNELRTIMAITMLLVSGLLSAGAGDDDETKSKKSFAKYQLSRLLSEFTFYINPFSFTDIFNKAIPMVSFIENFANLIKQLLREFGGIIIDDQGMISSAHPIKAAMRALPVFSEFSKFIPLIDAELGKEMGIRPITTKTFF